MDGIIIGFLVFLSICVCAIGFLVFLMSRNHAVLKERLRVNSIIHELSLKDIKTGKDWSLRYGFNEDVSYDKMLWQFWKPVKSFYPEYLKSQGANQNDSTT